MRERSYEFASFCSQVCIKLPWGFFVLESDFLLLPCYCRSPSVWSLSGVIPLWFDPFRHHIWLLNAPVWRHKQCCGAAAFHRAEGWNAVPMVVCVPSLWGPSVVSMVTMHKAVIIQVGGVSRGAEWMPLHSHGAHWLLMEETKAPLILSSQWQMTKSSQPDTTDCCPSWSRLMANGLDGHYKPPVAKRRPTYLLSCVWNGLFTCLYYRVLWVWMM